jgi:signal transduction histidine kinase/CheY-like chemotaxis protein
MRRYSLLTPIIAAVAILGVLFIFAVVRQNVEQTDTLLNNGNLVARTLEIQAELDNVLLRLTEAETGQRGFLLTGNESYLIPYHAAIPLLRQSLQQLESLLDERYESRLSSLKAAADAKLQELEQSIAVRREQGLDAALALVSRNAGERAMIEARQQVLSMSEAESTLLATRRASATRAYRSAVGGRIGSGIVSAALLIGVAIFALVQVRILRRNQDVLRDAAEREQQARAEAERSNQLKDDFLAVLSHELRTPLNAVLGWTQILQGKGDLDPAVGRAVGSIKRNAEAQQRLVEDLLDVSRIVTGKFRLEPKLFELRSAIAAAIDGIRPVAEAKNVRLTVDLGTPVMVDADAYRIQQVASNLLSNAVKFTPPGGDVFVGVALAPSGTLLTVRDTGVGMEPTLLPHVFERFRQGDSGPTRAHGGLGLGLAIVKHIVAAHGGTIEVHSEGVNRGATFVVCLPSSEIVRPGVAQRGGLLAFKPVADNGLNGVPVLVVDDERDSRDLLGFALQEAGAVPLLASSGAEALDLLKTGRAAVVLSDVQMPEMDGFELLSEIRRRHGAEAPPAIAITARARTDDAARAVAAGFVAHITKPVDLNLLMSTIRAVARRAEST